MSQEHFWSRTHTTHLAKYKKPSPFHYSVIVLGEIDHTHQDTRSASHWSPSLQFTPQWMHKLIVGWMKLGSESRRIVPHLLHTLLPIFKNFWESIIGVNPHPHVYVQWVAFFRLDASTVLQCLTQRAVCFSRPTTYCHPPEMYTLGLQLVWSGMIRVGWGRFHAWAGLSESWVELHVRAAPGPGLVGGGSVSHRRLLILGAFKGEEVLQLPCESFKGGALHGVLVPTLNHYVV